MAVETKSSFSGLTKDEAGALMQRILRRETQLNPQDPLFEYGNRRLQYTVADVLSRLEEIRSATVRVDLGLRANYEELLETVLKVLEQDKRINWRKVGSEHNIDGGNAKRIVMKALGDNWNKTDSQIAKERYLHRLSNDQKANSLWNSNKFKSMATILKIMVEDGHITVETATAVFSRVFESEATDIGRRVFESRYGPTDQIIAQLVQSGEELMPLKTPREVMEELGLHLYSFYDIENNMIRKICMELLLAVSPGSINPLSERGLQIALELPEILSRT